MVLTAWVFVAPEAEAATAGSYYVKVSWNVVNSGNFKKNFGGSESSEYNDSVGMTLTYKSNNGTGTASTSVKDLKSELKSKGAKTTEFTVSGFPTR